MRPAVQIRRPLGNAALGGATHEIGARIRTLRLRRRRTLRQLADATGLSASMVSMVEREQANPSIRDARGDRRGPGGAEGEPLR